MTKCIVKAFPVKVTKIKSKGVKLNREDILVRENRKMAVKYQEAMQALKEMETVAYKDARTNLYNASFFKDLQKEKNDYRFVLFLDIDDLKGHNTNLGHVKTDQVIKALSDKFQSLVRNESDYCIRYAGDEFVLVFHVDSPNQEEKALEVRERLVQGLTYEGVSLSFGDVHVKAYMSIGIPVKLEGNYSVEMASISCLDQKKKNKENRNTLTRVQHHMRVNVRASM